MTDSNGKTAQKSIPLAYKAPVANTIPTLSVTSKSLNRTTNRITISAKDSDGTIANVDIYVNGVYRYYATPNTASYSGYFDLAK